MKVGPGDGVPTGARNRRGDDTLKSWDANDEVMGRLRALGYAIGVALVAFVYLALPLLRDLYGPMVDLPVYGGLALFAGFLTYVAVRRVQTYAERQEERSPDDNEVLVEGEVYRVGSGENGGDGDSGDGDGGDRPEVDVEVEMEQLKDED